MTGRWMLGSLAAGVLLALAAVAAEPVAAWFRLPRRWIWAAAMAGAVLLPLAAVGAPELLPRTRAAAAPLATAPVERPAAVPATGLPAAGVVPPAPAWAPLPALPEPRPLPAVVLIAWMTASLATLGTLAWAQRRVRRACGACAVRHVAGTRVLVCEHAGPMVLGVLNPVVVLPRWVLDHADTCRMIVRHEREHVAARDPWLLAAAALAVAAMPWSPALWWMHRRLRLAVETDCDARVLAAGESRRGYVDALLEAAGRPAMAMGLAWGGRGSQLERRLRALTAPRPRLRVVRALPLAALACVGAAAACRFAADSVALPTAPAGAAARSRPVAPLAPSAASDTTTVIEESPDGELTAAVVTRAHGRTFTMMIREKPIGRALGLVGVAYSVPDEDTGPGYPEVVQVDPGMPAEQAGLRVGDRVVRMNGIDARRVFSSAARIRGPLTIEARRGEAEEPVIAVIPGPVMRALLERSIRVDATCLRDIFSVPPRPNPDPEPCFSPRRVPLPAP